MQGHAGRPGAQADVRDAVEPSEVHDESAVAVDAAEPSEVQVAVDAVEPSEVQLAVPTSLLDVDTVHPWGA